MPEEWKIIESFPDYSVSNYGRVRTDKSGRILRCNENQYGLLQVGLMHEGVQKHRSVPLLVAKAFLPEVPGPFDTPINLDGDRHNNRVENLMWRPRWFAVKYNQQFRYPYEHRINELVMNLETKEIFQNSFECAKYYGLLEDQLVESIMLRTYAWPTFYQFGIVE